jgi:hypothetical protein
MTVKMTEDSVEFHVGNIELVLEAVSANILATASPNADDPSPSQIQNAIISLGHLKRFALSHASSNPNT